MAVESRDESHSVALPTPRPNLAYEGVPAIFSLAPEEAAAKSAQIVTSLTTSVAPPSNAAVVSSARSPASEPLADEEPISIQPDEETASASTPSPAESAAISASAVAAPTLAQASLPPLSSAFE
jgi:hypothetical protein